MHITYAAKNKEQKEDHPGGNREESAFDVEEIYYSELADLSWEDIKYNEEIENYDELGKEKKHSETLLQ